LKSLKTAQEMFGKALDKKGQDLEKLAKKLGGRAGARGTLARRSPRSRRNAERARHSPSHEPLLRKR
jgi:hypothetical protein